MSKQKLIALMWCASIGAATSSAQAPPGNGFTYQGRLKGLGMSAISNVDFQFSLFDAAVGGSQIGSTLLSANVGIVEGLFTLSLDFGPGAFDNDGRWMEVSVRSPAGTGVFTTLAPRQSLTPAL